MAYEKQNFVNNSTVLTAEHMDHIEAGIVENETNISKLSRQVAENDALSLGVNPDDGLIYIYKNGKAYGTGVEATGDSGDVVGYIDADNNIVLSGNVPDGTYTIKYEMENGTIIDIGEMVLDSNTYYSVTNDLTNCAISNNTAEVVAGESYHAVISANDGYELSSVMVTMGGTYITDTVYTDGGIIDIASVTGDIVITAVAVEVEVINQIPISTDASGNLFVGTGGEAGYKTGYRMSLSSGNETSASGYEVTGFIPVKVEDVVRIKNIDVTNETYTNIVFYNSDKTPIKGTASNYGLTLHGLFVTNGTEENGVYTSTLDGFKHNAISTGELAYIRIGSKSITDESIVTVNQEIV